MTASPSNPPHTPESGGRLRAYWQFLVAVIYFFLARTLAHRAAFGLASDRWFPLVEQAIPIRSNRLLAQPAGASHRRAGIAPASGLAW